MQSKDILRYWRDQEFFRLFDFDQLISGKSSAILISSIENACKLPWDFPEDYSLDPEYDYAFDLFLAPFLIEPTLNRLASVLPNANQTLPDYINWGTPNQSCIARIAVDNEGVFLLDEFSLSTFPWAVEQLMHGRQLSLSYFDEYGQKIIGSLGKLFSERGQNASKFPTWPEIKAIHDIFSELNCNDCFARETLGAIIPYKIRKKRVEPEGIEADSDKPKNSSSIRISLQKKRKIDILNSFFLRDLGRVESAKLTPESAAGKYIEAACLPSLAIEKDRINIRNLDSNKISLLAGQNQSSKSSLWPDDTLRTPSTNQRLAIDLFLGQRPEFSLMAVNGPPGTGKTSLVKDILAQLIVKRAEVLAKLPKALDAFSDKNLSSELPSGFTMRFRKLIPELSNLGLVIASSNNNAVENITRELPNLNNLGEGFSELRFLESVSRRYERELSKLNPQHEIDYSFWGLPTVTLGRRSNRRTFSEAALQTPSDENPILRQERLARSELSIEEWRNRADLKSANFSSAKKAYLAAASAEPHDPRLQFCSACALSEAWVREVPKLEKELRALKSLLNSPDSFPAAQAQALWDLFFMLVPAFSTTLASVERMLSSVGSQAFGYVVVEEAGQALPQSTIGIITRAKRVLLIGDQRQIEPIPSTPPALSCILREGLELPKLDSAQSIADRQMQIGANISNDRNENLWVGLPLTEHRRCNEPMFSISNQIAYDNLMTYCTPRRSAIADLGPSSWIDVKGKATSSQWVPEQGQVCKSMFERLLALNDSPDVFFISPFRAVRTGLLETLKESLKGREVNGFSLARRVGTIHTFQGKEADIVFLVLGCDFSCGAAADWAGEKPNLVNVAITRARRNLYVIGDIDVWHRRGYFSDLLRGLPVLSINHK